MSFDNQKYQLLFPLAYTMHRGAFGWLRVVSKVDALIIDMFNETFSALRLLTRPLIKKL